MPYPPPKINKRHFGQKVFTATGSVADMVNQGYNRGQRRTFNEARGAYQDLITKEHRAAGRWRRDEEVRNFCQEEWKQRYNNENDADADDQQQQQQQEKQSSSYAPPTLKFDSLGRTSTIFQRDQTIIRNEREVDEDRDHDAMISHHKNTPRGVNGRNNNKQIQDDQNFLMLKSTLNRRENPPKRRAIGGTSSWCTTFNTSNELNLPSVSIQSLAAAGGGGSSSSKQQKQQQQLLPNSNNNSSYKSNNNNPHSSLIVSQAYVDDDDDTISVASTTLSKKDERQHLKLKLAELEYVSRRSKQERERLDSQIDEINELLINLDEAKTERRNRKQHELILKQRKLQKQKEREEFEKQFYGKPSSSSARPSSSSISSRSNINSNSNSKKPPEYLSSMKEQLGVNTNLHPMVMKYQTSRK